MHACKGGTAGLCSLDDLQMGSIIDSEATLYRTDGSYHTRYNGAKQTLCTTHGSSCHAAAAYVPLNASNVALRSLKLPSTK